MYGIAVDIGATRTRVALVDEAGRFLARIERPTVRTGDELAIPRQVAEMAKDVLKRCGVEVNQLKGIGIGSIGPLDVRKGRILKTANLPFENVPMVEYLSDLFRVPVTMLNDCTTAVVGERFFGAGKDHENLVYITISTGIGGGVYVDGHLLIGKDGNAAEIGHMVVDKELKLMCGCGRPGHWEAYCSGSGIPKLARLIAEENGLLDELEKLKRPDGALTAKEVYEGARRGNKLAILTVKAATEYNAIGFINVVQLYDPSLITVGGSVALNNPDLVLDPLPRLLEKYLINRAPKLMLTPLGDDVVLYGAAALALGLEKPKL